MRQHRHMRVQRLSKGPRVMLGGDATRARRRARQDGLPCDAFDGCRRGRRLTTALVTFSHLKYLLGPLLTSLLDVRFAHWPVVDRGVRPRLLRALLQVRVESRP